MQNQELINLLKVLSERFHSMVLGMDEPDGIIKSISITLDKALFAVNNNLPITLDVREGLDKSVQVAVKLFEGSGIDDDLFEVKALIDRYCI